MTHINHFAAKLKALRALHNMHQSELCKRTGIHRSRMVDYEQGRSFPGAEELKAIEAALGVSFNDATDQAFATLAPEMGEAA